MANTRKEHEVSTMFDNIFANLKNLGNAGAPASPQRVERPSDLSEKLGPWLRRSLDFAEDFSLEDVVSQLRELDTRRQAPGFRLAFVGEFNRGKSTLVNRLLERPLLPTGVLPTTATLTSIIAGSEERMGILSPDGDKEVRPLEESSWDDLLASDPSGEDQEVFAQVYLTLDHPWLNTNDVELIDTPGAGDLSEYRTAIVFDLLGQCDGAVLLISAASPFSMTEAAFLEQEVVGRHIPRILVVVSNLDTLSEDQKENVLAAVREGVGQISEAIPVLPSHSIDSNASETAALEAVRVQIEAMVAKGDRRAWRSRQIAGQLLDYLNHLTETGESALVAARMNAEEREQELRRIRNERSRAELQWEGIRVELTQRRLQRDSELREKILSTRPQLLEAASLELDKVSDPKTWWEHNLPQRLRSELIDVAGRSEEFLMDAVARDLDWLQREVSETFTTRMPQETAGVPEQLEMQPDLKRLTLADVRQYRLLARIGSGAGMVGSFVLISPIGIAASVAALFGAETILNQKVKEQREVVRAELERSVDLAYGKYCEGVSERLRYLYRHLEEDVTSKQAAWQSAQATMETSDGGEDEKDWQQMLDEASTLRDEILAALEH